nr:hypothetical protein [Tanacetum cinerariifolium]
VGNPIRCYECEGPLRGGFCWFRDSRAETSFAYDLNPNSFDDSQNLSDYPPQPQYETYPCELCGNDSHYERTVPLKEIISQIPLSIVITTSPPILLIKDPKDFLIIRNEDLSTILEKESDEFIKSSVEDLVPIPITPFSDSNDDEYFATDDNIEHLLHHDPSIPKMSVASILEGFTYELPLEENDDLFDLEPKNDDWKKILYDAPIDDLMSKDNVFDLGICVNFFLQHMRAYPLRIAIIFSSHM